MPLGNVIYRVWSTDWLADPARETAKLLAWLGRVRERIARELGDREPKMEVSKPTPKALPAMPPLIPSVPVIEETQAPESSAQNVIAEQEADTSGKREPRGRKLQSLGDFQTYEAIRGKLYEIWRDKDFLGEVEVVKRATAAPRLYGDRAMTAQSEYEGRVEKTGDAFRSYDVYAAMREVASRAAAED